MLTVPWLIGVVLAHRAGVLDAARLLLGPAWLVGYLAFNAGTLMAKAAPARRGRYRAALLTYGLLAAVIGGVAVLLGGIGILWWAPVGAVLVGIALALTRRKQERSLAAGLVSVLAGTGVGVVTRFWSPLDLGDATAVELATLAATIAYFAGTIFVVKTMIRERGSQRWVIASIMVHLALFAGVGLAFGERWLGLLWPIWAALALVRASVEPRWAGRLRPLHVGLVEIGMSALLLVCVLI